MESTIAYTSAKLSLVTALTETGRRGYVVENKRDILRANI